MRTAAPRAYTPPACHGSSRGTSPCSAATSPKMFIPSGYPEFSLPVHQVILTSMGCWILDNCNFEDLARLCKQEGRYEFLTVVTPLRMANGTGAPVNPIAIF